MVKGNRRKRKAAKRINKKSVSKIKKEKTKNDTVIEQIKEERKEFKKELKIPNESLSVNPKLQCVYERKDVQYTEEKKNEEFLKVIYSKMEQEQEI